MLRVFISGVKDKLEGGETALASKLAKDGDGDCPLADLSSLDKVCDLDRAEGVLVPLVGGVHELLAGGRQNCQHT